MHFLYRSNNFWKVPWKSPNPLANQLWCIDFLTPPTPLIIPHRLPVFLESLMPLKNWCPIHARCSKSSLKHSIRLCGIFSKFKTEFYSYRSSKVSSRPDCIFEIHQLWPSVFSRVYSNCCCSCSFEREIIKIRQSSHTIYSNNILNFQESTPILNAGKKKVLKLIEAHMYIYINRKNFTCIGFHVCPFVSIYFSFSYVTDTCPQTSYFCLGSHKYRLITKGKNNFVLSSKTFGNTWKKLYALLNPCNLINLDWFLFCPILKGRNWTTFEIRTAFVSLSKLSRRGILYNKIRNMCFEL